VFVSISFLIHKVSFRTACSLVFFFVVLAFLSTSNAQNEKKDFLKNIFESGDLNKDQVWTFDEAKTILPKIEKKLKKAVNEDELRAYFDQVDSNRDGKIDKAEFKAAISQQILKYREKKAQNIE
jgi:Ca2+-binding EF-hand superfamily protein